MVRPILPSVVDPIGRGIDALVRARPTAARHVERGRYSHPFAGWRAQEAILLARIAEEIRAARLPTAEGDALRALAASEFDTDVVDGPTRAIGTISMWRPIEPVPAGVIRKGSTFRRVGDPSATPARVDVLYAAVEDVYVPRFTYTAKVIVEATAPGTAANIVPSDAPQFAQPPLELQIASALFDPTFRIDTGDAGGGSDGVTDDDVRRMARAFVLGRVGPTTAAILAGALLSTGVKRVAAFEDPVGAQTVLTIADGSFSGSTAWAARVRQRLYDEFVGFGCKVAVGFAQNRFVKVTAKLTLRDAAYRYDTSAVLTNAQKALRRYFDDRPDWYSFRNRAVRAVLARCDPRVLTCTSAIVESAWGAGPMPEPAPVTPGAPVFHYWLADDALSVQFENPR
jgi:Baseplate J-like protein